MFLFDTEGVRIHPKLNSIVKRYRLAMGLILVTPIIMAAVTVIMLYSAHQGARIGYLPVIILIPSFLMVFGLLYFFKKTAWARLLRASRVLNAGRCRSMIMNPKGLTPFGSDLVELRSPDVSPDTPPWGLVQVLASKYKRPAKGRVPVTVYEDTGLEDAFVVIDAGEVLFWGPVLNRIEGGDPSVKWIRRLVYGLTVLFFLGLGLMGFITYQQIQYLREDLELARSSRHWPKAEGIILSSQVHQVRIRKGKGSVPGFEAEITYQYDTRGDIYQGDRISFGYTPTRDAEPADRIVSANPKGKKIQIAHQPENPALSVLEPGHEEACQAQIDKAWQRIKSMFALGFVAVVLVHVVLAIVVKRREKILGPGR